MGSSPDWGIEPVSLALSGKVFTTEPQEAPFFLYIWYLNMPLGRSHFSSKVYVIASSSPHWHHVLELILFRLPHGCCELWFLRSGYCKVILVYLDYLVWLVLPKSTEKIPPVHVLCVFWQSSSIVRFIFNSVFFPKAITEQKVYYTSNYFTYMLKTETIFKKNAYILAYLSIRER